MIREKVIQSSALTLANLRLCVFSECVWFHSELFKMFMLSLRGGGGGYLHCQGVCLFNHNCLSIRGNCFHPEGGFRGLGNCVFMLH